MIDRTREQVMELGAGLPASAEREVELEPGNAYYFLNVRKTESGPCGGK
jgi:hypothetical protein